MGTQRGRFSCVIPGGKQARVGGLYCVTIQVLSLRAERSGERGNLINATSARSTDCHVTSLLAMTAWAPE